MFLKPSEIHALKTINDAVSQKKDLATIEKLCTNMPDLTDRAFPYTYAGVLLALGNRVPEAITLLRHNTDAFSTTMADFLTTSKEFVPSAVAFADSRPYDAFTKTKFYNDYTKAKLLSIKEFAKQHPPAQTGTFNIVDIGTGNGVFIGQLINEISTDLGGKNCHLTIIEQSKGMNDAAYNHLMKNVHIPLTINAVEARVENLSRNDLAESIANKPAWLMHAGLSLHHMPKHKKINTLKNLRGLSRHFLLTENNANHDLPDKDSPEFIYSVYSSYGFYLGNVLDSDITDDEKRSCNHDFLLAEAITMLKNDKDNRVDYHATIEQWTEYAKEAGYKVVSITNTVTTPERPMTFTMHLTDTDS